MWPWEWFRRIDKRLAKIEECQREALVRLVLLQQQGEKMAASLDDLKAKVEANTTVIGSAMTLLVGLKTALDEAIAQLPDQTALAELSAKLAANNQALADAVVANTPTPPTP